MRWDFFRYLLDIHSLTVAASKDGDGGGPPEISGRHKDRDKSQPQLLASRNLHHHQLIVSLSPSTTTTNNGQHDEENDNNHSVEDYPSTDKKSAHHSPCSSGVTIIPSDPSMPSSSSSPAMKITTETNSTHSLPIINYNGNVPVDDSINQNVPAQRKAAFLISESSPRSSSSLFPSSQHKESRRANGSPNCENYEATANKEEIHHHSLSSRICSANHSKNKLPLPYCKESLRKGRANINLHNNGHEMDGTELHSNHNGSHHHSPSFEQNGNFNGSKSTPPLSSSSCACSHLSMSHHPQEKFQSPSSSSEKGIYSININETTLDVGNDKSHPSLKYYYDHYPSHCNSLSSSTDANNAEAEIVLGTRARHKNEQGLIILSGAGGVIHANGGGGDLATEDEASSIASSFCSSSATIGGGGDALINGDGADVEFDIDAKIIKRSETSESNGSTTTSLSNPAENHLPIEDKPSALFSPSPVVSSSYNTLRWTKAVANQENLAQIRNLQQHHSLPRYLHHRHQEGDHHHHHRQSHIPSGTIKKGRGVEANKKESAENDFLGGSSPFPGYNNAPTNTAISNIINTGTTCSTSVVATSTMRNGGGGSNEAMNGTRLNAATLLEQHPPRSRPTSIIGGNNVPSLPSSSRNNRLLMFQDKWRVLFDKFDHEGFGEITWTDFLLALRSKEFQLAIEPGKLQLLEDLARVHSKQTGSITFQFFVNIMTGKRSRSFKCAVHHRDREVCSESDFHLLPLGYQSPTGVKRMARLIADEFLTDERDRKYYADHYRCLPPPLFIISITLIELGFFTYYTVWHGEISSSGPLPMDSPFVYRPDKRQEVWRFLFYMVLHAGWVHLMFNLLVQLLVGLPLEMVHGSLRIGCVYMAGVLAGSLGTSVFDPDVYLVGASGGVYALLAAHLANVLLNYNNMEFGLVRLLGVFLIASVDVGFAIYDRYAASPPLTEGSVPPVSYVAHLTGALAGLTIGLLVLKNFEQKLREQLMWWFALGIYAACTLFAILFNIFHRVYPEMIPSEFVEIPEKFPHHQIQ